jgi:hypothetical protein
VKKYFFGTDLKFLQVFLSTKNFYSTLKNLNLKFSLLSKIEKKFFRKPKKFLQVFLSLKKLLYALKNRKKIFYKNQKNF